MSTIKVNTKYLITTEGWFIAPDGKYYNGVFGTVHSIDDAQKTLGIKTNARATNWYIRIGNMIIAECQINYAIETEKVNLDKVRDAVWDASSGAREFLRPPIIYDADESELMKGLKYGGNF